MIKNFVRLSATVVTLSFAASPLYAQSKTPLADKYRSTADKMIAAALADSAAWNRLAELTDKFGPRLSGSARDRKSVV